MSCHARDAIVLLIHWVIFNPFGVRQEVGGVITWALSPYVLTSAVLSCVSQTIKAKSIAQVAAVACDVLSPARATDR